MIYTSCCSIVLNYFSLWFYFIVLLFSYSFITVEPTISKKVKPSSISKAVGVLVAMLTISVLSVGAIVLLLGGFYKGRKNIELGDEMDEENTVKDVGSLTKFYVYLKRIAHKLL